MSDDLFPVPSLPPSKLSPSFWPGITSSSTDALRTVLKDNHKRWHIFFDPRRFHNHAAHFAIALWSLGADGDIIKAAYKLDCEYQRPAFESPEEITIQNFANHLGDDEYYNAYLKFFTNVVRRQRDPWAILEEYIFDTKRNFDASYGDKQPEMLGRFLDGLIHPMIHTGYGFEFGIPGMIVEGLASTAVHKSKSSTLLPASLFQMSATPTLKSWWSSLSNKSFPSISKNTHALTILARILGDPQFEHMESIDDEQLYKTTVATHGDAIRKYASEWSYDRSDPKEAERKIEELVWTNVIIYGIAGWTKGQDYNADFFYMHLVTSSLFLSSLSAHLKPASQELLLRSYLVVCLTWYVSRGCPGFDIPGFFAADIAYPTPPGPLPIPDKKALLGRSSPKAVTPNPWLPIIQTTLVHPDDHLPKLQRALAHYGALYGTKPAGLPDFAETELPGADVLDGTLFIRVAGLTAKRLGRVRDGEKPLDFWDQRGFHKK